MQTQKTLAEAAAKAGMDEKTARKYRDGRLLPSQRKPERNWRTRPDPLAAVWKEVEGLLERDPSVEAKTVFDHLVRSGLGDLQEGRLRTLQRRIRIWRTRQGEPKEVMFAQEHRPGEQAQSDFTHMTALGIRIAGEPFAHLLYHFVLTYSNWETGMICFSESFESLSEGLQNALWELGAVPEEHRTDSLTAAVNNLGERGEFQRSYQELLAHYGLRASHTQTGEAHENGDVEQSHHRIKRAAEQELILRDSREFGSVEEYEEFLHRLFRRRNRMRREKLAAELAVMRRLPERRLEDFRTEDVTVTRESTIRVRHNTYSVDSRLIRHSVQVRVYGRHLEVWYAGQRVETMERLRGEGKHRIQYRHVIHSLVKKPGAFRRYRYRSDLFPRLVFRVAYDQLREQCPTSADRQYLQILKLAADVSEERVAGLLQELIETGKAVRLEFLEAGLELPSDFSTCRLAVRPVDLLEYDGLLGGKEAAWA